MRRPGIVPIALCLASAASVTAAHEPLLVPPGEGRVVPVPFHGARLMLPGSSNAAGASLFEFTVPPRSGGAPPHRHTHEDELIFVLDGTLSVMVGDEVLEAPPGTSAALTRGSYHAFWNAGDDPVSVLFFVTDGGFEEFFDAVVVMLRDESPAPGEANARIGALAAEHGIEIRPDLLPAEAIPLYAPK